jgi:hypothetical protein
MKAFNVSAVDGIKELKFGLATEGSECPKCGASVETLVGGTPL